MNQPKTAQFPAAISSISPAEAREILAAATQLPSGMEFLIEVGASAKDLNTLSDECAQSLCHSILQKAYLKWFRL